MLNMNKIETEKQNCLTEQICSSLIAEISTKPLDIEARRPNTKQCAVCRRPLTRSHFSKERNCGFVEIVLSISMNVPRSKYERKDRL